MSRCKNRLLEPILAFQTGNSGEVIISGQQYQIVTQGNGGNQRIDGSELPATATQCSLKFSRQFCLMLINGIHSQAVPQLLPLGKILHRARCQG